MKIVQAFTEALINVGINEKAIDLQILTDALQYGNFVSKSKLEQFKKIILNDKIFFGRKIPVVEYTHDQYILERIELLNRFRYLPSKEFLQVFKEYITLIENQQDQYHLEYDKYYGEGFGYDQNPTPIHIEGFTINANNEDSNNQIREMEFNGYLLLWLQLNNKFSEYKIDSNFLNEEKQIEELLILSIGIVDRVIERSEDKQLRDKPLLQNIPRRKFRG